jgi:hypothetical protein
MDENGTKNGTKNEFVASSKKTDYDEFLATD